MHYPHLRCWSLTSLAMLLTGLLLWDDPTVSAQNNFTIFVGTTLDVADSKPNDTICQTTIGGCTLRAAIQTANQLAKDGSTVTIRLQPATYQLTIKAPVNALPDDNNAAFGDLDLFGNINIIGSSLNGNQSTIDAQDLGSGVIDARTRGDPHQPLIPAHVLIQSVTIQNGSSNNGDTWAAGVTGYLGVSLELNTCQIRNNRAGPDGLGGGVYALDDLTVRNCFIYGNQANNQSLSGGGITAYFGKSVVIENSTIRRNVTQSNGGGIMADVDGLILNNTTVDSNDAKQVEGGRGKGGGIFVRAPTLLFSNSTISRNEAVVGGGLYVASDGFASPPPTTLYQFNSSVFTRNSASASFGGGVHVELNSANQASPIVAADTVFDQNSVAHDSAGNCSATTSFAKDGFFLTSNYNVSSDKSCFFPDSTSKRNIPAMLSALVSFTPTIRGYVPKPGSPLIDAHPLPCGGTDVRGVPRPQNGKCDIGAVEVVPGATVGTPTLTPADSIAQPNQPVTLTIDWSHPVNWRNLRTLDIRLNADGDDIPLTMRFTEGVTTTHTLSPTITITDGLTLLDSNDMEAGAGQFGPTGQLESDTALVDLAQSRLQPRGPNTQALTLVLALQLKESATRKRYTVELLATNKDGTMQGPEAVGTLVVGPFSIFLPVTAR